MSYQVLARKWRPQNFHQVIGQEHILTALANGLKENRLHHAYLFSGTRGVGKTSIARLLAKGLNCIHGVTAEPCGECEHCKAIENGNFIDLIEIDAASRTKVEDTRELLDNVQYKPVQGRYKVYLIDEVHMLSRHSFNALLKTLEEPPEYVKFLLATTDPQKLPITILSRCMQFHLKALSQQQIAQHLANILTQEKIPFEPTALGKIAKAAQGSVRDSLSLTDQAIAMSNADIRVDVVNIMLGLLDDNQPIEILYALHQGNGEKLMQGIQAVADNGADWDELLIEVGEALHQIAMLQLLPNRIDEESQLGFLAKHISPENIQFFYQIVTMGRKELAFAPNRRIGAEMTLLRALAFHPKFSRAEPAEHQVNSTVQDSARAHPEKESAVKKTINLVEMPVYNQHLRVSATPQREQSPPGNLSGKSTSNALNALAQIERLRASVRSAASTEEKTGFEQPQPAVQAHELPVVSMPQKERPQTDLIDRLASLAQQAQDNLNPAVKRKSVSKPVSDSTQETENEDDSDDANLAETYRWEWINPEMAEAENVIRPSEIKQAILKEKTPELVKKVIALAEERDDWTKTVEHLGLDHLKLVKQIALNSVILAQTDSEIVLGLRSNQKHLQRESAIEALQAALKVYYGKDLRLKIELNDDERRPTPLDYRRQIYHELSERARQDLQADKKVKLLQQAFDAHLDLDSIRPV
ncbi:DNA polymerase III subunit gamma/tau [Actinobacillus succinogenes]|uniref:DNA polymerase III subunit gamma/tau n=1 Tax=Actinobacillus succinogenes (strain ATCC 55618 / DSM 22257 / CCUG 43843 / 130Z) TaxID=339671 RepID=A6VMZ2_ACTSZ|nr:DNA polymerase III subunit gamma/tau [Actinobacillus succinogenes]ABR74339.1 DNA polymerase III, subunits gamma and tau [Actinobacillus succinogenes 130Z]PHI39239.1 DNA polymerase III subunit gamma/tau [Actinobacillus succinogenes]